MTDEQLTDLIQESAVNLAVATQRLGREKGFCALDITHMSALATAEIAAQLGGNPVAAVEYLRNVADVIEKNIMEGTPQ